MNMFCYQCQETARGKACTSAGVCGKTPQLSGMLDLLIWTTKGMSEITTILRRKGIPIHQEVNNLILHNLFTSITNVNFDEQSILLLIQSTLDWKSKLAHDLTGLSHAAEWNASKETWSEKAKQVGVLATKDENKRSLRELITYGLKGLSAYCVHAETLGFHNEKIDAFIQQTLASLIDPSLTVENLTDLALETGKYGVDGMALLDKANTSSYGNPEISEINLGTGKTPGILISGHDLKDLEMLLNQTKGQGVDIYTHGEMLPAHYYPLFKKYDHLAGNYGNAWWKQREEFESFNGPILMTTNCIVPPKKSYQSRLFTTGDVRYPECPHIECDAHGNKDFSSIIKVAKACSAPRELESGSITGGFAHNQTLALTGQILEAVNSGRIRKFVVMAGCDGRDASRNYYANFAQSLPSDVIILTAGCAKYKYNKLGLGDIDGIPRVLDAGQCNDSYSLVIIALKLAETLGLKNINNLPIVYNIAWYEQKAVIVLLALLHLGIKNIHLGPTLPAFLSPDIAAFLSKQFGIAGIGTIENDMKAFGL